MKQSFFSTMLALCGAALLMPSCLSAAPEVTVTELPDRLRVEIGGELFTEYLVNSEQRFFPAFYPVLGPGQVPMTRSYPFEELEGEDTDHPHHQSLWFAHCDVNGENFWAVQPSKDGKEPGKTVHRKFTSVESGKGEGGFVSEDQYVGSDGKVVMSDTRTVRFIAPEDPMGPRIIDIEITFRATDGPIHFGDDKDAGMAIRLNADLQVEKRVEGKKGLQPWKGHLLNSEGISGVETWGKRARWVDAYGEVGGEPVGVAILDHPSNPRYPTYWHSRSYGLVTANIFGKHHFEKLDDAKAGAMTIPAGESQTFRWRFAFHRDTPEKAGVEALQEAFAKD